MKRNREGSNLPDGGFGPGAVAKAIWFGILVLMTVGIGLTAPPVGLNVYVVNGIARDVPMSETYKGVLPFVATDMQRMLVLLAFPVLALSFVTLFFRWRAGGPVEAGRRCLSSALAEPALVPVL
jgi:hypothetical protein